MLHNVLFVDDESNVLSGLQRVLRKEPFAIITADSPQKALEVLRTHNVTVVVSDQDMPGMTGVSLLTKIKEEFPHTARFILTGKPTLEVVIQAINEGAISRFFIKPCNEVDLALTIRQAIEHRDLQLKAERLDTIVKKQTNVLQQLENEHPGITKVEKGPDGAIIL